MNHLGTEYNHLQDLLSQEQSSVMEALNILTMVSRKKGVSE